MLHIELSWTTLMVIGLAWTSLSVVCALALGRVIRDPSRVDDDASSPSDNFMAVEFAAQVSEAVNQERAAVAEASASSFFAHPEIELAEHEVSGHGAQRSSGTRFKPVRKGDKSLHEGDELAARRRVAGR